MSKQLPRRRWYQFSLRTMFVLVTLFCVMVGLGVRWVQHSQEWIRQRREVLNLYGGLFHMPGSNQAPGFLWLFGEQGVEVISCSSWSKQNRDKVARLFPEAEVIDVDSLREKQKVPGS